MSPGSAVSLYYFLIFGGIGTLWPLFTIFLKEKGLPLAEVTQVLGLLPVMGIIAPPVVGLVADAWNLRGWFLRIMTLATALVFLGFFAAHTRAAIWGTVFLYALCRSPLNALADASAFEAARLTGKTYGRLRRWGSIGFMLTAALGGELKDRFGNASMLASGSVLLMGAAAAAWLVPKVTPHAEPQLFRKWRAMLSERNLWFLLGAVALQQMAMSVYDGCYSLHLQSLGMSGRFIGGAWAIGVATEVLLIAGSGAVLERFGAERTYVVAIAIAALRWLLIATVRSPLWLLALQPLHGISFGYVYVAGVTLMRGRADPGAVTSAMGLFAAANSVGAVIGYAFAGRMFERQGAGVFFFAAAIACAAALCATGYHRRHTT